MVGVDTSERGYIGEIERVVFNVAAWAPANAEVELSFACMFECEMPGAILSGGLLHLDQLLGGTLTELRSKGAFRAQEMETLRLTLLPGGIRPRTIVVIGLGKPETLNADLLERALRIATREAVHMGVRSVAFAPDLLDAGYTEGSTEYSAAAMLKGVVGALEAERELRALGFAPPLQLEQWTFDAGVAHVDAAVMRYRTEFEALRSQQQ